MSYWGIRKTERLAAVSALEAGDSTEFVPGQPVDVKRVVAVVTTAITTAAATVTLYRRPTVGSDTDRVEIGSFMLPVSAIGDVVYFDVGEPDGDAEAGTVPSQVGDTDSEVYASGPGVAQIDPGESLLVDIGSEAAAGAAEVFVEYLEQPFAGDRVAGATKAVAV